MRNQAEFWATPKTISATKDISLGAKAVYGVLWTMMNGENVAWPSQKKIGDYLIISMASAKRYLKELEDKGLVVRERLGLRRSNRYFLIAQSDTSRELNLTLPTVKEQGKRTNEYKSANEFAGEVNKLMPLFKAINPTYDTLFSNRTERKSLLRLLERFGIEKVRATIEALPGIINKPYAPKITTPYELEKNLGKLISFVNQEKAKNQTNIAIIS